jgi:hypothetical protein
VRQHLHRSIPVPMLLACQMRPKESLIGVKFWQTLHLSSSEASHSLFCLLSDV